MSIFLKENSMKTFAAVGVLLLLMLSALIMSCHREKQQEALFNKKCLICHRHGSKFKTIRKPEDIIQVMRNPRRGMPKFDEKTIPDKAAESLAQYVFYTIMSRK